MHVLSLPLAFILSQDQTLRCCYYLFRSFLIFCCESVPVCSGWLLFGLTWPRLLSRLSLRRRLWRCPEKTGTVRVPLSLVLKACCFCPVAFCQCPLAAMANFFRLLQGPARGAKPVRRRNRRRRPRFASAKLQPFSPRSKFFDNKFLSKMFNSSQDSDNQRFKNQGFLRQMKAE